MHFWPVLLSVRQGPGGSHDERALCGFPTRKLSLTRPPEEQGGDPGLGPGASTVQQPDYEKAAV